MFDPRKPVQTRDGKPARIIATDVKGDTDYKVIALIDDGTEEALEVRLSNGRLFSKFERPEDLINIPTVEYRALSVDRSRLGVDLPSPGLITRGGELWGEKGLKFTIDSDGEVIGVELA